MTNRHTAHLTRLVRDHRDAAAAVALLEHSMAHGHRRVALIRFLQAEHLGAQLESKHYSYVKRIADGMCHDELVKLADHVLTEMRRHAGKKCRSGGEPMLATVCQSLQL